MSLEVVERCVNGRYVTLLAVAAWLVRGPSVRLARQIVTLSTRATKTFPPIKTLLAKRPMDKGASMEDQWRTDLRRAIIRWTRFWCLQYLLQISCSNQSIGNNWAVIGLYSGQTNKPTHTHKHRLPYRQPLHLMIPNDTVSDEHFHQPNNSRIVNKRDH